MTVPDTKMSERHKQELKDKRTQLFTHYLKNPLDTTLAREIKDIDDTLAEHAERSSAKKRKV